MASITHYKSGYRVQVKVGTARDSETFRTMREAKAWGAAREIELKAEQSAAPAARHTVAEMLKTYAVKVSPKKQGEKQEKLRIEAFMRDFPHLASMTLAEFDTPQLAEWRDARMNGYTRADGTRARAVTASSVNRDINLIRNAFLTARDEWKWTTRNPFTGLNFPPAAPGRQRRVHPWHDLRPILRWLGYRPGAIPHTKYQETALAYMVALRTAMRAGEVLALGKETLDLRVNVARVHHKMEYLTGHKRIIPLPPKALRLLRPLADRDRCFTVTSGPLSTMFRRARDKVGVKGLTFHDSRGEALTRLARKYDVLTLSKISGIKDIGLLNEHYYRETPEQIAARL